MDNINNKSLVPKTKESLWDRLNKWFENNIKKINNNTPSHLKEGSPVKTILPMYNSVYNLPGVKVIAKNGFKFS